MDFLYKDELLDGSAGASQIEKARALISQGRVAFDRARAAGHLTFCSPPSADHVFSIVLLPPGETRPLYSADERSGFYSPANPGPIFETLLWNDEQIEFVMLHEMVHAWCGSQGTSPHERWLEEGFADWVAFEVLGKAPQIRLTQYFGNSCRPTLYGSSFLWALSRMQGALGGGERNAFLAELHLGLKPDLLYGSLPKTSKSACSSGVTPHGELRKACPASLTANSFCLPLWRAPWDEFAVGQSPSSDWVSQGVFYWAGE